MALVDGGDLVARAIKQENVDTIYTLCGGHVQAIFNACLDEGIKVIDVRHEQVAGHAAEALREAERRRVEGRAARLTAPARSPRCPAPNACRARPPPPCAGRR